MKYIHILLFTLFCPWFSSHSATIAFVGVCEASPFIKGSLDPLLFPTVGDATVAFLLDNAIDFQGTTRGLNSVLNSPVGLEALDVVGDNEMYAYGWCYSVNGVSPEVFADQVSLGEEDEILWWYGFAHFKDGQWLSQCVPSYQRVPSSLCPR